MSEKMQRRIESRIDRRRVIGGALAGAAVATAAPARRAFAGPLIQSETTIEYWHPPHGADPDAEKEFFEGLIAQFEEETPGVKVNLTIIPWGDVYQKWTTAIAAGAPPDVSISGSEAAIQFAGEGHLLPVTDLVEELGGEATHWDTLPYFRYEEDLWQVPYIDGAWVLYYNPAMLRDLGQEAPPATWEATRELARTATKDGVFGLPFVFSKSYTPFQAFLCLQSAWGAGALSPEGEVQMTAPGMADLTEFYVSILGEELTPPDALTWSGNDEALAYLTNGRAPMVPGYGNRAQKVIDDAKANGIEIGIANMPLGPGDRPGSFGATNGHMIFTKAKNPDAARQFIRFIHRDEHLVPWSQLTGWIPPLRSVAESAELNTPGQNAMRSQLEAGAVVRTGYAFGGHPANGRVEGQMVFSEMLQEIAIAGRGVEETLADYQTKLEELYASL